jgi:hypothetical protein
LALVTLSPVRSARERTGHCGTKVRQTRSGHIVADDAIEEARAVATALDENRCMLDSGASIHHDLDSDHENDTADV